MKKKYDSMEDDPQFKEYVLECKIYEKKVYDWVKDHNSTIEPKYNSCLPYWLHDMLIMIKCGFSPATPITVKIITSKISNDGDKRKIVINLRISDVMDYQIDCWPFKGVFKYQVINLINKNLKIFPFSKFLKLLDNKRA